MLSIWVKVSISRAIVFFFDIWSWISDNYRVDTESQITLINIGLFLLCSLLSTLSCRGAIADNLPPFYPIPCFFYFPSTNTSLSVMLFSVLFKLYAVSGRVSVLCPLGRAVSCPLYARMRLGSRFCVKLVRITSDIKTVFSVTATKNWSVLPHWAKIQRIMRSLCAWMPRTGTRRMLNVNAILYYAER